MSKKRVSLTLSEEIVEKIDSLEDSEGRNRSRKVENVLKEHFSKNSISIAAVFCGSPKAKSLERQEGKTVIEHVLDHLVQQGVKKVYLLTGPNEDSIKEVCGEKYRNTEIQYVLENEAKGNAAALRKLENKISEPFAAVNGHVITDVDLEDMHKLHKNTESMATIALTAVQDPSNYGAARLKGDKILAFEEKPEKGEEPSKLINAGTYVFEPEIFEKLNSNGIDQVFEKLANQRHLSGYIYGGKWVDASR